MFRRFFASAFIFALVASANGAQEGKPTLIVETFSIATGVVWPYDMNQLKAQTVTELVTKDGQYFAVLPEPPKEPNGSVYKLEGEVLEWHAGNRAKRMFVGVGSGRETAKIHYWLTDSNSGKRVFDHTDTIRQAFWGNAYANSVGQLAQPFADKIAERLKEAKLVN